MPRTRPFLLAALAALALTASAVAQEADPAAFLPAAEDLGEGWVAIPGQEPPEYPDNPQAGAVFGGPGGARLAVYAMMPKADTQDDLWAGVDANFGILREWLLPNEERQPDLDAMAPPPGCARALRVEGDEILYQPSTAFPAGVTVCAGEAGPILTVLASGTVLGETGVAASDAVVELLLSGE